MKTKKYWYIFRMSIKQEKDTFVDLIFRAISFFLMIFIFFELWGFIYGEGGTSQIINGYSFEQMIWYLIITELMYFSVRNTTIIREISNEIKSGSISYKLNKPYNYYLYVLTNFMAKSMFMWLLFVPVALIMGFAFVGNIPSFCFEQIVPCLFSLFMSTLLGWSLYAIVGLIAFWLQDATPFGWIVSKFIMLLGLFFPVEFFPSWLQPIITYSPIYSIMSGPASLVANFSWELFAQVAISQVAWAVILISIGMGILALGKRKVVSNGG